MKIQTIIYNDEGEVVFDSKPMDESVAEYTLQIGDKEVIISNKINGR